MKCDNVGLRIAFRNGIPIAVRTPPCAQLLTQVLAFRFCQYPSIRKRLNASQLDRVKATDVSLESSPFVSQRNTRPRASLKFLKQRREYAITAFKQEFACIFQRRKLVSGNSFDLNLDGFIKPVSGEQAVSGLRVIAPHSVPS